jgi:hypothetical protein
MITNQTLRRLQEIETLMGARDGPVPPEIIIEWVKPAPFEFDRHAPDEPLDEPSKPGEAGGRGKEDK